MERRTEASAEMGSHRVPFNGGTMSACLSGRGGGTVFAGIQTQTSGRQGRRQQESARQGDRHRLLGHLVQAVEYNRFYQEYSKKGVVLIAVASDSGTEAEVREAAKRLKMEYPVAAPALKDLDRLGEFEVLPTTWVFDARGKLVKEFLGASPDKHRTLRSLVGDLLTHAHAPDRSPRKNKVH